MEDMQHEFSQNRVLMALMQIMLELKPEKRALPSLGPAASLQIFKATHSHHVAWWILVRLSRIPADT